VFRRVCRVPFGVLKHPVLVSEMSVRRRWRRQLEELIRDQPAHRIVTCIQLSKLQQIADAGGRSSGEPVLGKVELDQSRRVPQGARNPAAQTARRKIEGLQVGRLIVSGIDLLRSLSLMWRLSRLILVHTEPWTEVNWLTPTPRMISPGKAVMPGTAPRSALPARSSEVRPVRAAR
jgi:hypothetical protein